MPQWIWLGQWRVRAVFREFPWIEPFLHGDPGLAMYGSLHVLLNLYVKQTSLTGTQKVSRFFLVVVSNHWRSFILFYFFA